MIKDRLGATPLVLQLPIGAEAEYEGLVDLVRMKEVVWKDEALGAEYEYVDSRDALKDQAEEYRAALVEAAVEVDDDVMEAYLEGTEPDEETLIRCIRKGTIDQNFVPVLNGGLQKQRCSAAPDAVVTLCLRRLMWPPFRALTQKPKKRLCANPQMMSRFPCWRSKSPMTRLSGH